MEAVVFDLDGTILKDDLTISKETIDAVELLKSRGIPVFIATGRLPRACSHYHDELGLDTPMICANGSIIYDRIKDEMLAHQTIALAEIRSILADLRDKSSNVLTFYLSDYYCLIKDRIVELWMDRYSTLPLYVGDYSDCLRHDMTKMEVFLKNSDELFEPTDDMLWSSSVNVYSSPGYIEIVPNKASKWNALKILLEQRGIEAQRTAAFGDSSNDIEMLTSVGIGIAMGNASAHVKAIVREGTLSNENNGVAQKVNEWLLGRAANE